MVPPGNLGLSSVIDPDSCRAPLALVDDISARIAYTQSRTNNYPANIGINTVFLQGRFLRPNLDVRKTYASNYMLV